MKLFLFLTLTLSLNVNAETLNWSMANVTDTYEREVVAQSTEEESQQLTECMRDERETDVSKTSCINEVFGDVHN